MFTHSLSDKPAFFGAPARAVGRALWHVIRGFFALLLRVTRGMLKLIGISMLFMTDMW